jgi:hypothetical protein
MPKPFRTKTASNLRKLISGAVPRQTALASLANIVQQIREGKEPDLRKFSRDDSDDLERVLSAILASLRANHFQNDGSPFKLREATAAERIRLEKLKQQFHIKLDWADHISVAETNAGLAFVVEPYGLTIDEMRELVGLTDAGWWISIDDRWATYFPGHAICILLLPPKKGAEFADLDLESRN